MTDRRRHGWRRVATAFACAGVGSLGLAQMAGVADAAPAPISGATFEWGVNAESNTGAYNGDCNFMSAGESDGSQAAYRATDANATVVKRNAAGDVVPIGDYATRCLDPNGVKVTPSGTARLDQKMRFTDGTGTYDPATGEATIRWTGTVSLNYYGALIPFWISDPELVVDATGRGTVTATLGGYASSIDDPMTRTPLDPVPGVVIATLAGIDASAANGFTATPDYAGVTYDATDPVQLRFAAGWGSWPKPFVDFHLSTGLASYWYTSGVQADVRKAPSPITVSYGALTVPTSTTTTLPGATTSTSTTVAPATSSTAVSTTTSSTTSLASTSTTSTSTSTTSTSTSTTLVPAPMPTDPPSDVLASSLGTDGTGGGDVATASRSAAGSRLALTGSEVWGLVLLAAAALALGLTLRATARDRS